MILQPFMLDDLAERILNGRIVALDKVAVHELHRERRLAYPQESARSPERAKCNPTPHHPTMGRLTNRSAAHNGNLALFCRHV